MDAGKAVLLPKGLGFLRNSRPSSCRKTQGEHERAWGHANSNRGRRRVRRHTGAGFAAGTRRISAQSGEDDRGGALSSPSASLSKSLLGQAGLFRLCTKSFGNAASAMQLEIRGYPALCVNLPRGVEQNRYAGGCANVRSTGSKRRKSSENPI